MPSPPLIKQWVSKGLKLFFKLLYHQFAWAYDVVAWIVSLGTWNNWVKSVLPSVRGPQVLEIGHGPGHLLLALNGAGYHVAGLDESRAMGRQATRRLFVNGLSSLCINGYAQYMPFPTCHFDTICATFPSEYIFDPNTLAETYRVLVPEGRLVILPTAWFAEAYKPGRILTRLLSFTGQLAVNSDVYTKPLVEAGFEVNTELRTLASSQTLIILATKPQTG